MKKEENQNLKKDEAEDAQSSTPEKPSRWMKMVVISDKQQSEPTPNKGKRWTSEEEQVYINFVLQNPQCFANQKARRSGRVFQRMSALLDHKRSSEQCRTHHQKMRKKVQGENIKDIIRVIIERKERKDRIKMRKDSDLGKILIGENMLKKKANIKLLRSEEGNSLEITVEFKNKLRFNSW